MTTNKRTRRTRKNTGIENINNGELHGEIITWNSGTDGSSHLHSKVVQALVDANLDPKYAKKFLPRNAFSRAIRKMRDNRVIKQWKEEKDTLVFQFTKEMLEDEGYEYQREAFVSLNKITGEVLCDDGEIQELAQGMLDKAMVNRTTADITRIVQQVFDDQSDLIPLRDAGGVYFVPEKLKQPIDQVDNFLRALDGGVDVRVPVFKGTKTGDATIQNAVNNSIDSLINDYEEAVNDFSPSTRKDTIEKMKDNLLKAKQRINAYAHYLGNKQAKLTKSLNILDKQLASKVKEIGGGKKAYSSFDWDEIFDGKVHKLEKAEGDYNGTHFSVLANARKTAKDRGHRVRTKVLNKGKADESVILQAIPADGEDSLPS